MARTRKYSDEQIVAALKKTHGMVYLAAQKIGCDATTIYERAKTSEAITNVLKSERGVMLDTAENKLLGAIKKSEPWAIQFALKMLGKDRGYSEKPDTSDGTAALGAVLRELIRDDVSKRHTTLGEQTQQPGEVGSAGLAPGVADAPAPPTD